MENCLCTHKMCLRQEETVSLLEKTSLFVRSFFISTRPTQILQNAKLKTSASDQEPQHTEPRTSKGLGHTYGLASPGCTPRSEASWLYMLPTLVYDSSSLSRFPVQCSAVFHPLYRGVFLPLSCPAFIAACWAVRCKQSRETAGKCQFKKRLRMRLHEQRKSHIKPHRSQTSGGYTELPQLWQSRLIPLQTRLVYNVIKHPTS